jgi:hypothetical protein
MRFFITMRIIPRILIIITLFLTIGKKKAAILIFSFNTKGQVKQSGFKRRQSTSIVIK